MILDAEQLAAIRRLNRAAKQHYGEDSAQRWAFVAECLPSIHPEYPVPDDGDRVPNGVPN